MKLIGRLFKNEIFSLSTLFFVLIPMLNHVMAAHGAPDISGFTSGNIGSTFAHVASQASTAGFTLAQVGTGQDVYFINHGPIFMN